MHHINNIISHLIPSSYLNHYVIQEKIAKRPKKNTTEVSYLYWIADVLISYLFVVYQHICMDELVMHMLLFAELTYVYQSTQDAYKSADDTPSLEAASSSTASLKTPEENPNCQLLSYRQYDATFPSEDIDAEPITSFFRGDEESGYFKQFGSKRQAEAWMNEYFNGGPSYNGTYNVTAEVENISSGMYVVKITKVLDENQFGE